MQDLHLEIKQLIIDSLNLEGLTPDDIDSQAPLFGDGLGLDSIDALELGLASRAATASCSPPRMKTPVVILPLSRRWSPWCRPSRKGRPEP